MFLREPQGLELAGSAAGRSFGRAPVVPLAPIDRWRAAAEAIDWTPDLGSRIGSSAWWRGLGTCVGLIAAAWMLNPGVQSILGAVPPALSGDEWEEARPLAIAPLGQGADTGRRMAANDLVRPLAEAPERPTEDLTVTLGDGDAFTGALQRAGVGRTDAADASTLVAEAVSLGDLRPGTRLDLTLGRRASRTVPRPLERLVFRARFDLNLQLSRASSGLAMTRQAIAIDRTPLRLQGLVGAGLYRSLRAAGAPARAAEEYIKAIATKLSIGQDIAAADRFDLVIDQARAATGEVQLGALQLAGIDRAGRRLQLVRWAEGGREDWWDADGRVEHAGMMGLPVAGHVTSGFGWRLHPVRGIWKQHLGMDIGAAWGSPIVAAMDGVVTQAGWAGGYGNFVKLAHSGAIATGYGHMSRIAVAPGMRVQRGQVIGHVGTTGLSTGPHLHWEVWRNGVSVDPRSISFASVSTLSADAMRAFRARVAALTAVTPGGAR